MNRKRHWFPIDYEFDGEERAMNVRYEICPAEPDVGIPREYIELYEYEAMDGSVPELSTREADAIVEAVERELQL